MKSNSHQPRPEGVVDVLINFIREAYDSGNELKIVSITKQSADYQRELMEKYPGLTKERITVIGNEDLPAIIDLITGSTSGEEVEP